MVASSPKSKNGSTPPPAATTALELSQRREQLLRELQAVEEQEQQARREAVVEAQIAVVQSRIAHKEARLNELAAAWNQLEFVGGYPPSDEELAAAQVLSRFFTLPPITDAPATPSPAQPTMSIAASLTVPEAIADDKLTANEAMNAEAAAPLDTTSPAQTASAAPQPEAIASNVPDNPQATVAATTPAPADASVEALGEVSAADAPTTTLAAPLAATPQVEGDVSGTMVRADETDPNSQITNGDKVVSTTDVADDMLANAVDTAAAPLALPSDEQAEASGHQPTPSDTDDLGWAAAFTLDDEQVSDDDDEGKPPAWMQRPNAASSFTGTWRDSGEGMGLDEPNLELTATPRANAGEDERIGDESATSTPLAAAPTSIVGDRVAVNQPMVNPPSPATLASTSDTTPAQAGYSGVLPTGSYAGEATVQRRGLHFNWAAALPPVVLKFLPVGRAARVTAQPATKQGGIFGGHLLLLLVAVAIVGIANMSNMVGKIYKESHADEQASSAPAVGSVATPASRPQPTVTQKIVSSQLTTTATAVAALPPLPPIPTDTPPATLPSPIAAVGSVGELAATPASATPPAPDAPPTAAPPTATPLATNAPSTSSPSGEGDGTRIPTGSELAAPPPPSTPTPSTSEAVHIEIPAVALATDVAPVSYVAVVDDKGRQLRDEQGQLRWRWLTNKHLPGLETPSIGCGEAGNVVMSGHNWGNGVGVFAHLSEVKVGDKLKCLGADGNTYTYSFFIVNEQRGAKDKTIGLLRAGEERTITLYTCNESGTLRMVFVARLEVGT